MKQRKEILKVLESNEEILKTILKRQLITSKMLVLLYSKLCFTCVNKYPHLERNIRKKFGMRIPDLMVKNELIYRLTNILKEHQEIFIDNFICNPHLTYLRINGYSIHIYEDNNLFDEGTIAYYLQNKCNDDIKHLVKILDKKIKFALNKNHDRHDIDNAYKKQQDKYRRMQYR